MAVLAGKKAFVCGSTQGIGRACAVAFAEAGATVTLIARHEEALKLTRDALPADHGQTHDFIVADFRDYEKLRAEAITYVEQYGPVHILLNNSGGPPAGPAFEAQPDEYLNGFKQHVLCSQVLLQSVALGMRDAKYGRVINIISTSVVTPIKGLGVSNTIRGAMNNWARTVASELGPFGITVNNILPGFTATTRLNELIKGRASRAGTTPDEIIAGWKQTIPLGRFAEPEEIGAVAAFLASPAASYINGVNLPVDGGRLAAQ